MILVCMLGTDFGGLEKLFLDQLQMLASCGIEAKGVVAKGSPTAKRAAEAGLHCEELNVWTDWDPISLARVRAIVKSWNPEMVLCQGRKAHRVMAHAIGASRPIVAMTHKPKFDADLPYAAVIASAEHRFRTLTALGVPAEKIALIPNPVELPHTPKQNYALTDGVARIVAMGRLHPKKGFGILIDALALVAQNGIAIQCIIAGEGDERATLEARIKHHGLGDRVSLPGWTDDVQRFLLNGDIFVLPSFQEDFPLAMLEAMACAMPVIASRIEGPRDILREDETALIVPPHDSTALAGALRRLIPNESLREKLGRAARADAAARYSFPATAAKYKATIEDIRTGRPMVSRL